MGAGRVPKGGEAVEKVATGAIGGPESGSKPPKMGVREGHERVFQQAGAFLKQLKDCTKVGGLLLLVVSRKLGSEGMNSSGTVECSRIKSLDKEDENRCPTTSQMPCGLTQTSPLILHTYLYLRRRKNEAQSGSPLP